MWQRIQTLWWLLSIIAVALFISSDFLLYSMKQGVLPDLGQRIWGVYELSTGTMVYQSYSVAVIAFISLAISTLSIFIYKMRPYQIRLSILNTFVLLGLLGASAYVGYDFVTQTGASFSGITAWLSLPFVAIIAQTLAARAVLQDEMLVRMSNRIR